MSATGVDEALLRRAISLAAAACTRGEPPFGAVLADAHGRVLAEAMNTSVAERDRTAHAEMNVARHAAAVITWDALRETTLYASCEPCPMCSAAAFYVGIRRIVFGLSAERLQRFSPATASLGFSCREILSHAAEPVHVLGPLLEDEAAAAVG